MSAQCTIGYCGNLASALIAAGHSEVPDPLDPDIPFRFNDYTKQEREDFMDYLLDMLIGNVPPDPDYGAALLALWESIDNEMLVSMIERGDVIKLKVNRHGYFVTENR